MKKFKNLERYRVGGTGTNMSLAIPLPRTPSGRTYRYSPNENAHPRHFLIGDAITDFEICDDARARMKLSPRSNQTVCPYSGVIASDEEFIHPDDQQAGIDTVHHAIEQDISAMMEGMFRDIGRKFASSKSISIKPGKKHRPKPKPHFVRSDLLRELICDHCGRDYGVFAIALFCPDCGAPNVRLHFERERTLVGAQVDLAEAQGDGLEELAYRLLGNAHEDVLTAFEATLKTVYLFGAGNASAKPPRNDFQNIEKAKKRFEELGVDPFQHLVPEELTTLELNIQKRHVIGHNLGVVDPKFADHAREARVGETVHLVASDIREFAALCQKVVDDLDAWLVGTPSPTVGEELSPLLVASPANPTSSKEPPTLDKLEVRLRDLARRVGLWLAKKSTNGNYRDTTAQGEEIVAAFPNETERALEKAVAELETEGFVTASGAIGVKVPFVCATTDLFPTFDPVAYGTNPYADAGELIGRILAAIEANGETIDPAKLHEELGWELRRFNPALGIVVEHVDSRRVSDEYGSEYVTRYFFLLPEDEIALERLAERLKGRGQ